MGTHLRLTARHHAQLHQHLFPSDGKEAVALALCGRHTGMDSHWLAIKEVHLIPYDVCDRHPDRITWPTSSIAPLLQRAEADGLAMLKIHGHPNGYQAFSHVDDRADAALFPSIHGWIAGDGPHASAVMLPNGRIFGRAHFPDGAMAPLEAVTVVGDEIKIWRQSEVATEVDPFAVRHAQAFGKGTYRALRALRIAVIGCSGTGSVVIDMLARLGVGHLVLVDPDHVELKNLNRILNTSASNVGRLKVDVQREFVSGLELGTTVETFAVDLGTRAALDAVATCDIVFGCMDGIDGRHLLNRLATFYILPYIDVGVRLDADGEGGVSQICGSVHYLQPGRSSLMSRRLYTAEQLRAASLKRYDPEQYTDLVKEKYLKGILEDRPAVNAVNMFYASMAVLDFLARIHGYRDDGNTEFAVQTVSLTGAFWLKRPEGPPDEALARHLGRGDVAPFLDLPYLDRQGDPS